MRLEPTPIAGALLVEQERIADERGYFARTFDAESVAAAGGEAAVVQCNTSFNPKTGTLRGMHYQAAPHGESKLVRCTRGAILDVIVDLRPASDTYRQWFAVELTAENGRGLMIPEGIAHGFQTLADDSEVFYMMGSPYVADAARGVRWDDPAFGIAWPPAPPGGRTISDRDARYPDHVA